MPSYNLTLDDISPLWVYKGQWKDQDETDSLYNLYANSTFHATNQTGASVSITFNGTGIYLYGAFRVNHDGYSVTVDDVRSTGNGYHPDPIGADDFQLPLFGRGGLDPGLHTVVLTDLSVISSRPWLDLDFGVITLGDGNDTTKSTDVILDDNAPNITYTGNWEDGTTSDSPSYYDQTMHRVNLQGATATVAFYGNAVSVFGATSSNHGPYTVSIDGGPAQSFSALSAYFHAQQILYAASDLNLTDHTLVITNTATDSNIWFDLDYVVASTWPPSSTGSPSPTGSALPAASPSGTSSSKSTPVGAIAGGVVGGVLVLIAAALLAFFLIRRRRRRAAGVFPEKSERDASPFRHPVPYAPNTGAGVAGQQPPRGPESEFAGSTVAGGSEAPGAYGEHGGENGGHQSMTGHIDLPPPGYDQVLRNSPHPASGGAMSLSPPGSVTGSSSAPTDIYASGTGYVPPTKGERHSTYGTRRALPTPP